MAGVQLTLGEKIALARMRRDESQKVFGKRFGVIALTVAQWEKGRTVPTAAHQEILKSLFREVYIDQDENLEIQTFQGPVPFNEPIEVSLRIGPQSESKVRLSVEVRRKAS